MKSVTTLRFRKSYAELPAHIKEVAKKAYRLWKKSPYHESLKFKKVHTTEPVYSVRIGLAWRALGVKEDETIIWFWIGSHAEYDKLVGSL
jgi:phage-related tail protein